MDVFLLFTNDYPVRSWRSSVRSSLNVGGRRIAATCSKSSVFPTPRWVRGAPMWYSVSRSYLQSRFYSWRSQMLQLVLAAGCCLTRPHIHWIHYCSCWTGTNTVSLESRSFGSTSRGNPSNVAPHGTVSPWSHWWCCSFKHMRSNGSVHPANHGVTCENGTTYALQPSWW